jgi:transposase
LEASGYSSWFEEMLESLGHQVWVGDATEIRRLARRRQKNDKRDAEHILELLVKGEFPRLHRQRAESREVLRQLRYRQRLVKINVMIKNNLHAIALGAGLSLQTQLSTVRGRERLEALPLSGALAHQREAWLQLLERVGEQIASVERWLKGQAWRRCARCPVAHASRCRTADFALPRTYTRRCVAFCDDTEGGSLRRA